MAKLGINTGSIPNDGTGDTLLAAALKINQNFDEIYSTLGDGTNIVGVVTSSDLLGYATTNYVNTQISNISVFDQDLNTTDNVEFNNIVANSGEISGVTIGSGNTEFIVNGDARITGILTVGTASITLDPTTNTITAENIVVTNPISQTYYAEPHALNDGLPIQINVGVSSSKTTNHRFAFVGGVYSYVLGDLEAPYLNLIAGKTYWFIQEDPSNATRPIKFYTDIDQTNEYTDNVSTSIGSIAGEEGFYTELIVTEDTPNILYYDNYTITDNIDGYMGNQLNIIGSSNFNSLNISGISTLGVTSVSELSSQQIIVSGAVTATSFSGSGANITGISTLNIVDYGIGLGGGGGTSYWVSDSVGINTSSNIGIGTTAKSGISLDTPGPIRVENGLNKSLMSSAGFTVDGPEGREIQLAYNTNPNYILNNIGIGTTNATSALTVKGNTSLETLNVSGIATFQSGFNVNSFTRYGDGVYQYFGSSDDLLIAHISAGTERSVVSSSTNLPLYISSNDLSLRSQTDEIFASFASNGPASLYYDNSKKFETLGTGVTITGTTFTDQLSVSGVSTFSSGAIVPKGQSIDFGDLQIFTNTPGINNSATTLLYTGSNDFQVISDNFKIKTTSGFYGSLTKADFSGAPILYYTTASSSSPRLQITDYGVKITGLTSTTDLNVSGVVTATTFYGNLIGSIDSATNLTGGTANASSLNVSGITTISAGRIQADASANLRFGNLPAGSGSGRNIAIGDQVLVSLSGGQGRNIGIGELSYYDTTTGQYNIGIGERAGQKVSTGSYNIILGAYDGNSGNLDIRTSSNNVVIADGQGNIRQYINSSGNVGIKTTVVTEALTVAGIVSATSFYGTLNAGQLTGALPALDGSALIGVVGSGSGVVIEDDATPVGTAGTINFGSNLSVSFGSGIATVSASISGINTSGTSTFNQLNVSGVSTFTNSINLNAGNLKVATNGIIKIGDANTFEMYYNSGEGQVIKSTTDLLLKQTRLLVNNAANTENMLIANQNGSVDLFYDNSKKFETLGTGVTVTGTTFTNQLSISGNTNSAGIITASSFSGSGSGLTNLPAGQLTGSLPAIDGSALLNVTAAGTGVAVEDDTVNVGSATTIDFGTGLDVAFSGGVATITASGGSLQSRTTVTGVTTSIANNGIGNTNITGFKSYALMKVGLSTAGWIRLYTDSASRDADVLRSVGEDPAPGSGVIAEVVTTGISTQQNISPFVMGGNMDDPVDTTIYVAITNLSGSTQTITANLTILQLEA